MEANGLREADLSLVHAFGATLAGAVEEEDEGPGLLAVPVFGQVHNVAMEDAVELKGAIEEAGVLRARGGVSGQEKKGK
jgi:hypothetical protein